ncbi:hypothetical protein [Actinophytocola sp.]|uniref:hypothetical protein n=1 Tax=Actinophytocola sp. TaxID=1872138 RepID=UPI002D80CB4E|nr:hypothetical protein [Actinophytocola sp.]HET9141235.1 hypothetical protein [Actinophytocola sp.]
MHGHTAPGGGRHHGGLVQFRREPGDQVQTGGDARRPQQRRPLPQRGEQHVAAASEDRPHPAQVPVELAPDEEVGQRVAELGMLPASRDRVWATTVSVYPIVCASG